MNEHAEEVRERYRELLEELRTVIPGVQVLFAFLLTAPFSARFEQLDDLGMQLYGVALIGVAISSAVLMTPAALHRLGNRRDRTFRLRASIRCAISGLTLLAASVVLSVFVVARFVFDDTLAALLAGCLGAIIVGLWYLLALSHRLRR